VVATAVGIVEQTNHYYPYGMTFAEGVQTSRQPYKFGGKEKESWQDLGSSDFGARIYQPSLCEFDSGDPLMEKYYGWSTYGYGLANPMRHVDPDGRDLWDAIYGFISSLFYNNSGGLTSLPNDNVSSATDYNVGRTVGDVFSIVSSGLEILDGGGKMVGGVLFAVGTDGALAPLAAPALVEGAAETAHGSVALVTTVKSVTKGEGRVSEARGNGGGKNAKHANQKAKDSAEQKYQEAKAKFEELDSKTNKTPEEKKAVDNAKKQMDHWRNKRDFSGENHSQNAKGNR
jgi:RHS repeat-associated protein